MPTRAPRSRSTARLTSIAHRRGFTLIEILIVIVMISLISLVAIPRFATGNGRRNMESARLRTAAALSTARQAAIQKGEPVVFTVISDSVIVKLKAATDTSNILSPIPLYTLYKVHAETNADPLIIEFNARGFANSGNRTVIQLKRTGVANDSIVIRSTGMVQR
jgi:prepilin-type N-terminal cleavage/methylation domain-containing protein